MFRGMLKGMFQGMFRGMFQLIMFRGYMALDKRDVVGLCIQVCIEPKKQHSWILEMSQDGIKATSRTVISPTMAVSPAVNSLMEAPKP